MKISVTLCIVAFAVCVYSENCTRVTDCQETKCGTDHGWWLHCTKGFCLCSHDTYTGKPCTGGDVATCETVHGPRCKNLNLYWHCVDNICHCSRHQ